MSEYQYYEFLALDRPLTQKERAELPEPFGLEAVNRRLAAPGSGQP